jgi:hypothetical protein
MTEVNRSPASEAEEAEEIEVAAGSGTGISHHRMDYKARHVAPILDTSI